MSHDIETGSYSQSSLSDDDNEMSIDDYDNEMSIDDYDNEISINVDNDNNNDVNKIETSICDDCKCCELVIQTKNDAIHNNNDVCVICLEDLQEDKTIHFHCKHVLHVKCCVEYFHSLFKKNADILCPICRSVECYSDSSHYNSLKRQFGYVDIVQEVSYDYSMIGYDDVEETRRIMRNEQLRIISSNQQRFEQQRRNPTSKCFALCGMIMMMCVVIFMVISIIIMKKRE